MHTNDPSRLSDRQARAVIIAAERLGFEREPDLFAPWYDHELHEDARDAADYLRLRRPDALDKALVAGESIPADRAAYRITESGRFSFADAELVIRAADERGFTPPTPDLPLSPHRTPGHIRNRTRGMASTDLNATLLAGPTGHEIAAGDGGLRHLAVHRRRGPLQIQRVPQP